MTRPYAIGYSTCGFAGRDMLTLVRLLGQLGYEAVELELDRERLEADLAAAVSYLASDEHFRILKNLQERNLIVPVVESTVLSTRDNLPRAG